MSQARILHVASGDLWGGAEAAIYELCRGLLEHDVEVRAVVLNPGELASRLATAGIETTVLNERSHSLLRLFVELRRVAAVFRPHVIHSHRKKEHILACTSVQNVRRSTTRTRLVKTIHGAPEPRAAPPGMRTRMSLALDRWCERQFDARVAVSSDLATRLGREPGGTLFTVHNGIRPPTDAVRPRPPAVARVVGFAGRFVAIKRLDLLIKVAAWVRRIAPGAVRFEIVGAGPLHEQLLAQAHAAEVTDMVTFAPFQRDIWSTLAAWDVAILTSDHEGLPMICLEALAAGVPVFARQVGGLRELVLGPEQGTLVDSADPEEIARRLVRFVVEQVGAESTRRSRLPPTFTAERMCAGYLDVYARVGVQHC